jgi:Tol biopolymer transport system component
MISAQGDSGQELLSEEGNELDPTWSPDGTQIAFGRVSGNSAIYLVDLKTRQVSTLPGSKDLFSPRWSPDSQHLAALPADSRKLLLYDFKTQKWSEWINEAGSIGFPTWSRDGSYVYYDASFTDKPTFRRVKVGQTHSEFLLDLKDVHRYGEPSLGSWSGVAPDGSALVVLDRSTQEVYALEFEAP